MVRIHETTVDPATDGAPASHHQGEMTMTTDGTPTSDGKVLIGLTHADDEPENVLVAYLMGVEALRAGREALLWLTKDAVALAVHGSIDGITVAGAPAVADLHAEFVERGGRLYACPVCVKLRGLEDAKWTTGAEVKGAPAVYEFADAGTLTFNY